MMKKAAAMLLSACLALQPCAGAVPYVYGAAKDAVQTVTQDSVLEVEAVSTLLFPYTGQVTVQIRNGKGLEEKKELTLDEGGSALARFEKLPSGKYTVTVRSEKFAAYTQTIEAEKGWTHRIQICSSKIEAQGGAQPGWIRPGDVNGDGEIDKKDSDVLLEAVRKNKTDQIYDLNGDGSINIADLNALMQSMGEKQISSVEKLWNPAGVQAKQDTEAENTNALFQDEGVTVLKSGSDQPVSKENPLELEVTLADAGTDAPLIGGMVLQAPGDLEEDGTVFSQITDGSVTLYTQDGNKETEISLGTAAQSLKSRTLAKGSEKVTMQEDGSLVLDFGGQTAVKSVVIKITGTRKNRPLVEIAKAEFVNHMEDRIGAPKMDIPSLDSIKSGSKSLTAEWSQQQNVTGYELSVSGPAADQNSQISEVFKTNQTSYTVSSIKNNKLANYKEYSLKVRSVNGDWKSPWSEVKTGVPLPQKKPDKPDNVRAEGGFRSIFVSWKDMDDSDGYMVYYKEKDGEYQPAVQGFVQTKEGTGRLKENHYEITGLKEHAQYYIYVVSWNEFGWSGNSLACVAETKSEAAPKLPAYRLLNTSNGQGKLTAHIRDAVIGGDHASMKSSPLDSQKKNSALGLADDDYGSYWSKADWDDGVSYPSASKGMTITLDDDYQMNYFTFAAANQKGRVDLVRIEYWNSQNTGALNVGARLLQKRDENDNIYYIVKFDQTVTANKIHMSLGRSSSDRSEMRVGEIRFHKYDSLEDEIMGLYEDEMHTTLKSSVNEDRLKELETRLDTADGQSGEKHPLYQELSLELKTAGEILHGKLEPSYEVIPSITSQKDKHLGFGGLNAWQPLGKTAAAGETLLVYAGHQTKRTGESAQLQLVFTQHHAEAANVSQTVSLKIGRNEITVPKLSDSDFERGGQIYIAYTGNSSSDKYAVRISGGHNIPVLNIYKKTGEEKKKAIKEYIAKLEEHTALVQEQHNQYHAGEKSTDYKYDGQNCILNATDILMDQMMYSLPASQVYAGLGSAAGAEQKADKLSRALDAMEQMMTLFYQHKGLSSSAGTENGNNALPSQHLNIRYMRMFAGAFMYAAGNHIGIEWGSAGLASAPDNWNGFGWGVAHEIGHNINQGCYAVAEVTNNYFAQLMKSISEGGKTRFNYQDVYKKVTSGTTGPASNVAVQLAMYWQLYLAYGRETNDGRIYTSYDEQFQNLFFARVDTYARNPQKAPNNGVKLTGDRDQNLMRLSCAAAQKNILPFFERWGMVPDEDTKAYAASFPKEEKAVYYVSEEARKYRAAHPDESGTILNQDAVTDAKASADAGRVSVTIQTDPDKEDLILGYEIIRTMISNGEKITEPAGFQLMDKAGSTVFTEEIYAVNNRVLSYEVRAVDKYLNYSKPKDAGSVKIATEGVLDKSLWTVETDMVSEDDKPVETDMDHPDSGDGAGDMQQAKENSIARIADGGETDECTYKGQPSAGTTATVTIDMHRIHAVTALKYKGSAIPEITAEVSTDGSQWQTVKTNDTGFSGSEDGWKKIWFDSADETKRSEWIGTYDARYIRLKLSVSGQVTIKEIEICGPSGDNLEFYESGSGQIAAGILTDDFTYGEDAQRHVVPKGSLVFTGTYKGNPAYNAVILYDTKGNVIGGASASGGTEDSEKSILAKQVIFAKVPEHGNLEETSDGTWIYYIEPGQWTEEYIQGISGVRGELYRVDDAETLAGERIVSDTQILKLPEKLPDLTLTGNQVSK